MRFKDLGLFYVVFVLVLGSFLIFSVNNSNIVKAASYNVYFETTAVGSKYTGYFDSDLSLVSDIYAHPGTGSRSLVTSVDSTWDLDMAGTLVKFKSYMYRATWGSANYISFYNATLGVSEPIIRFRWTYIGTPSSYQFGYYDGSAVYHSLGGPGSDSYWKNFNNYFGFDVLDNSGSVKYYCYVNSVLTEQESTAYNSTAIAGNYTMDRVFMDVGNAIFVDDLKFTYTDGYADSGYVSYAISSIYNETIPCSPGDLVSFVFSAYEPDDSNPHTILLNSTNCIVDTDLFGGCSECEYTKSIVIPDGYKDGLWRLGVLDGDAFDDYSPEAPYDYAMDGEYFVLVNDTKAYSSISWYVFNVTGSTNNGYGLYVQNPVAVYGRGQDVKYKIPAGKYAQICWFKRAGFPYNAWVFGANGTPYIEGTGQYEYYYGVFGYELPVGYYYAVLRNASGFINGTESLFMIGDTWDYYNIDLSSNKALVSGYVVVSGTAFTPNQGTSAFVKISRNGTIIDSREVLGVFNFNYYFNTIGNYSFFVEYAGAVVTRTVTCGVFYAGGPGSGDPNYPDIDDYDDYGNVINPWSFPGLVNPVVGFMVCLVLSTFVGFITMTGTAFAGTFFGSLVFFSLPGTPIQLFPEIVAFLFGFAMILLFMFLIVRR